MKKDFFKYFSLLIIFIILIISLFKPLFNKLNYGLDLQGGFEVLYEAKPLEGNKLTREMLINTYKTILRRIDVLGVNEPEIIIEGNNRLRIQLAGITNEEKAREVLSKPASLSFRDSKDNLLMTSKILSSGGARLDRDSYGKPAVGLQIADNDKFYEVTNKIKDEEDNRIIIWLDFEEGVDSYSQEQNNCGSLTSSKCLSAASVEQAFTGNVIIQGNFTKEEATNLVNLINSGSIPTKLKEISSHSVGSLFGKNALNKTLIAGSLGIALIFLFFILIYRFAGFLAGIGIITYTFIVFLIFWTIGGVLTLPGIASLILGIGMAVDACVISFERIKEELKDGTKQLQACLDGYKKSFSSIIDANITTLIVALIMFILGESSVKGFATMLIINILVTIVVMFFLIKFLIYNIVKTKIFENKNNLFIGLSNKKPRLRDINFFKQAKIWITLSILVLTIGSIMFFTNGFNLSVDFKGGSYITLTSKEKLKDKNIIKDIKYLGYQYNKIENIDEKTVYLKLDETLKKKEIAKINKYFKDKYQAESEVGVVSNIVRKELTLNALTAVLIAAIGIILYVSIRFKLSYAIASLVPLFHDVLMVLAIFIIFKLEIAVILIAALLTIIGYSINDTVVIFDRIRENLKKQPKKNIKNKNKEEELKEIINKSLNENLVRTLYTSITTLLPVICLIFLGTFEIINFNLAILIGLTVGTYSSLFLASIIWYQLEKKGIGLKFEKYIDKNELDEIEVKGINK